MRGEGERAPQGELIHGAATVESVGVDALAAFGGLAAILLAMAIGAGFARLLRERESHTERDLDEGKRFDDEVRRAQKMEAIGRLAGGIANDFNNKLSIILGYSGIGLDGLSPRRSDVPPAL